MIIAPFSSLYRSYVFLNLAKYDTSEKNWIPLEDEIS